MANTGQKNHRLRAQGKRCKSSTAPATVMWTKSPKPQVVSPGRDESRVKQSQDICP